MRYQSGMTAILMIRPTMPPAIPHCNDRAGHHPRARGCVSPEAPKRGSGTKNVRGIPHDESNSFEALWDVTDMCRQAFVPIRTSWPPQGPGEPGPSMCRRTSPISVIPMVSRMRGEPRGVVGSAIVHRLLRPDLASIASSCLDMHWTEPTGTAIRGRCPGGDEPRSVPASWLPDRREREVGERADAGGCGLSPARRQLHVG